MNLITCQDGAKILQADVFKLSNVAIMYHVESCCERKDDVCARSEGVVELHQSPFDAVQGFFRGRLEQSYR